MHGAKRLKPWETMRRDQPERKDRTEHMTSWAIYVLPSKLEVIG